MRWDWGTATAEGVLADTVEYVKERKAFGAPIAESQNTKFKMAEIATDIRIHRSFVEECKRLFMAGELDVATVSMAKLSADDSHLVGIAYFVTGLARLIDQSHCGTEKFIQSVACSTVTVKGNSTLLNQRHDHKQLPAIEMDNSPFCVVS